MLLPHIYVYFGYDWLLAQFRSQESSGQGWGIFMSPFELQQLRLKAGLGRSLREKQEQPQPTLDHELQHSSTTQRIFWMQMIL